MLREIIEIDEQKCNGCGDCIPACHEGALQIIDNKARLISDLMCDGLGACLGECPTGALQVIQREAFAYDERLVMKEIIKGGNKVIQAHLEHLIEHNEQNYYNCAVRFLHEKKMPIPPHNNTSKASAITSENKMQDTDIATEETLNQWPIQLHLINPTSPDFQHADILLAADCSAFAAPHFHQKYLQGKKLLIACPKLDSNQQSYIEKLHLLFQFGQLNSITILRMDVPCCGGLAKLIDKATGKTKKKISLTQITINKQGIEV